MNEPVHPILQATEVALFANAPRWIRWNPLTRFPLKWALHNLAQQRQREWNQGL